MKKALLIIAVSISIVACNKTAEVKEAKEAKTAYVDTSVLLKEYTATKDLDAKYKAKGEEKGRQLEAEYNRLKQEEANFKKNAQTNGQEWAQQKYAELQNREQQLAQAQQALTQQFQQEGGAEMDTLVSGVKKFIKAYGKEKGYTYIYGTNDANASILYAEDKSDITKELVKLLNDKYKSQAKEEVKK
ncbi:MAG: OmpH family outer membrane protein [Flavobacterium sp.]|uniref:OmpH family outer membrane protein n=1 Tax=Flavobacterium sp. TaxID=239 RepID=UPI00261DFE24|nr:OmpH family outer membrane protein [Flavobacterium sp.]MDD5149914.1 OmpH family outer membrane protein [Flavobacterium sp.]